MKVVILAGGFGTRIRGECTETKTYGGNRGQTDSLAYHETLFLLWIQ